MLMSTRAQLNMAVSQLSSQNFLLKPYKNALCVLNAKPSNCSLQLPSTFCSQKLQTTEKLEISMSATDTVIAQEETPSKKKKLGVVVKPMEKPRIVLKFIWMEKIIGIALNQVIPGYGTIPLSPYYFWPKEDAWEKLLGLLESKPWISRRQMLILLNQATDIITLWQESGGKLQ